MFGVSFFFSPNSSRGLFTHLVWLLLAGKQTVGLKLETPRHLEKWVFVLLGVYSSVQSPRTTSGI